MSDIEEQAKERVAKAAWINDEINTRLHQNDVQPGITSAKDARADHEYPVKGGRAKTGGKVADAPK